MMDLEEHKTLIKILDLKHLKLRSDLRDNNDVYILVTRKTNVTNPDNNAYDKN